MGAPRSPVSIAAALGLSCALGQRPEVSAQTRHHPRPHHDTPATAALSPTPLPAYTGSFPGRNGRFTAHLTVAGEDRAVEIIVPRHHPENPPIVLLFHGTNGGGGQIIDECGAEEVAEREGFVVAAPVSRWLAARDWDHPEGEATYWQTAPETDPDRNHDLLLVRAVLDAAQQAYGIDPARVYVMGHSNGAFFALEVAMVFHDRIAAFAENSGGIVRCESTPSCAFRGHGATCEALSPQAGFCRCEGPDKPISVVTTGHRPAAYLAHGTDDPTVTVAYTCALATSLRAAGYEVAVRLRDGEGHACPGTFVRDAWPFLAAHPLALR